MKKNAHPLSFKTTSPAFPTDGTTDTNTDEQETKAGAIHTDFI
jgi:hypothetical protein